MKAQRCLKTDIKLILLPLFFVFTVIFSVSCGGGGGNSSTSSIEENHPPQLSEIGNKTLFEGSTLSFVVTATDPDNDQMTFIASGMPIDAIFTNQVFEWNTAVGDAGTYSITFEVSDDDSQPLNDSKTITITVVSLSDQPTMQYGVNGPFTLEEETFENSMWSDGVQVSVLLPVEREGKVPVVFFSHAYGATNWHNYETLLQHLVSLGLAVVFSPYPTASDDVKTRYAILWNGFEMAADTYSSDFDLLKIGFIGHSFGGGATPSMAWKSVVDKGWGGQSVLMFIMAPWYVHEISETQLSAFPENINLIVQVYDQDDVNDHRMATDIFNSISIKTDQKSYCNVPTGIHSTPSDREKNDLDRYAVREVLDALVDYTFEIDRPLDGKAFALDGLGEHLYHTITKLPAPVGEESNYEFPWSSIFNPRYIP